MTITIATTNTTSSKDLPPRILPLLREHARVHASLLRLARFLRVPLEAEAQRQEEQEECAGAACYGYDGWGVEFGGRGGSRRGREGCG